MIACHIGCRQILKRHAGRFERGAGTLIAAAGMRALTQFGKICADVIWCDLPSLQQLGKVPRKRRPCPQIDENLGLRDRLIVAFAHVALEGTDQIKVAAGFEPVAMDDWPC